MANSSELARKRRAVTKFWLAARVPIIVGAIALVLIIGGSIGYGKFRASQLAAEKQELEAGAQKMSQSVSSLVAKTTKKVRASVNQGELVKLLASGNATPLSAYEKKLASALDEVISVKTLPVGYDRIDRSVSPPIGYAVLNMIKKAEEQGKEQPAEMQLFGDEHEHVALLTRVEDTDSNLVGHQRWALDSRIFKKAVKGAKIGGGYAELVQPVAKSKPLVIAAIGAKASRQGPATITSKVKKTAWRVSYWSEHSAAGEAGGGLMMPLIGGVVILVVLTIGFKASRQRKAGADTEEEETAGFVGEAVAVGSKSEDTILKDELEDVLDMGPPPLAEFDEGDESPEVPAASESGGVADLSPEIFRAYDIRGVVGESLSPDVVRNIGRAIGSEAYDRAQQTVVVGCDGRLSGPELMEALIEGLRSTGRDVIDIGRVPTPVLYFATHYLNTGSGVIVTGSHNPPEYNGLKMMLGGDTLFGDDVTALRTRIESGDLMSGEGSLQTMDVLPEYIRRVSEDIPVALGNAFKVVVDCGNGVAGDVAPKLIRALGHDVIELFCEVDGNFPNHHPDPSKPENLSDLVSAIKENDADIGFAFDGDGDRLGVVDKNGRVVWPDLQMMLYSRDVISRNPGAQIVFDVKCTSRLPKVIKKLGGEPLMWKTGHSFIKNKMKETGALLAGEMSGHIFFKERWYGFDDAMYAAARMLELLMGFKQSPTEVFAKLPTGIATPELNVTMEEGAHHEFMQGLMENAQLGGAEISTIDGLRADYKDGWGLVRASNTTPSLVLRFEADNQEALTRIQEEFRAVLLAQDSTLPLPF